MGRHGKREPHVHAAGITLHRGIQKAFHAGEIHDFIELLSDLFLGHAEDRSVQEDIFPPGEVRVESRPDFQQRGDPPRDADPAFGGGGDPAQDLQERGFPGAVAADQADPVALAHLEIDMAQRPELLEVHSDIVGGKGVAEPPAYRPAPFGELFVETLFPVHAAVPDDIFLADIFDPDDGAHACFPFKCSPRIRFPFCGSTRIRPAIWRRTRSPRSRTPWRRGARRTATSGPRR